MPSSEDTCRIVNENELSILLSPNWECQGNGGLHFNLIVLVPETPFPMRCLAMKCFCELLEAPERWAISKTDFQVSGAWEVLDKQPPIEIDAPTMTHYDFVFQSNGTWYEIHYRDGETQVFFAEVCHGLAHVAASLSACIWPTGNGKFCCRQT